MPNPPGEIQALQARISALEAENARLRTFTGLSRDSDAQVPQLPVTETLAAIIQASPLPLVATTAEGNIMLWNSAAERVFGWSADEVMGKALPFIPEEKLDEHRSMRAIDLSGKGFTNREIRRRRKDGTFIEISVSTAPIFDFEHHVAGIMSVYVDITERKALQDWQRQQAELLEQAHDAIVVWDMDGVIEYWNRAARELYGYTNEEAIGQVSHRMLKTATLGGGRWFVDELRANGRWSGQLAHTTKDGRRIIVESRDVTVATSRGLKVLESNRDVTNRVRADRELRAANDALNRANSDLEQFAYAAAHDLQEPLRNIVIFAQLLRRTLTLTADASEYTQTIIDAAKRMQMLVDDLLVYSRSVNQDQAADHTTNAEEVLAKVLIDISAQLEESGATVSSRGLPVLPISTTHLSQLLQNLIGNAIKYRRPEAVPHIELEAHRDGNEWILSVADNGQGIPVEYRDRIFGLFKRLHSSETPGTGLGLAICKRIAEHYGGRIWVSGGGVGQGTTFSIALPVRQPALHSA